MSPLCLTKCLLNPCGMTGNLYTERMNSQSNVTQIADAAHILRRARGQFVKTLIEEDGRSARYIALKIGVSPSSMGERLRGKAPFLADELESIARSLKLTPGDFYSRYISVGPEGLEPPTSSVKTRGLATVHQLRPTA